MFGVTWCAQAERMSQLLPGGAEASSDQVGADRILEEQRVGSVPSHLSNCPSVLFKAGVHIVWTGRDGVEGRPKRRRHGQAGWLCLRTSSDEGSVGSLRIRINKGQRGAESVQRVVAGVCRGGELHGGRSRGKGGRGGVWPALGQQGNALLVHRSVALLAGVALVEEALEQFVAVLAGRWLLKGEHYCVVS